MADEVREIVGGLIAWRDDSTATDEDRQVIVADIDGQVAAVIAHSLFVDESTRIYSTDRYLMVTAVRADQQRSSLGRSAVEAVLADLRDSGAETVEWLVAPQNHPSIAFSRSSFPEADESQPLEVDPYIRFLLRL